MSAVAVTAGEQILVDQLVTEWDRLRIECDGRTVFLPSSRRVSDEVVFNVVLPLQQDMPESVAPARLWAASLPLHRHRGRTLQERIEDLEGDLRVSIVAGAAVLTGTCAPLSLPAALDAVRCIVHGQSPVPEGICLKARELSEQQRLHWNGVEARVEALAQRAVFGRKAPLPAPSLPLELVRLRSRDVHDYQSRRTDPGWLVVDAPVTINWIEPEERESNGVSGFEPRPRTKLVPPIISPGFDRGIGAIALASALRPPDIVTYWETSLASAVLGGYFASRLWERLRVRHGRVYNPRSLLKHSAAGISVLVTAVTSSEDLPITLWAIRDELAKLCRHGVDGPELRRAQRYLLGSLLRSASGPRRLSTLIATWLARGMHPQQLLVAGATIHNVKAENVLRAAQRSLDPSVMSLAVCGARREEIAAALTENSGGRG